MPAPRISIGCILIVGMLVAGCDQGSHAGGDRSESRSTVTVFAAASTTNAIADIARAFDAKNTGGDAGATKSQQAVGDGPTARVVTSFASSGTLAQQIINGAAADLFLSANVKWVDTVEQEGLVAERVELLSNRLVVIAPSDSSLALESVADLPNANIDRLALADTDSVPASIYARQALAKLGLWDALAPKVVAGADVRQALAYVEQGAAEAGIVYATDAAISDRVKVLLEIPADAHDPIVYPLVRLKSGADNPNAARLFQFLQSNEAAAIFQRYGFTVPAAVGGASP